MLSQQAGHRFIKSLHGRGLPNMYSSSGAFIRSAVRPARLDPTRTACVHAEPGLPNLSLENEMNVKQLMAAAIAIFAVGSAFAQERTTWVVPDAGFKSSMTRAEVRNELRHGDRSTWQHRDGEDMVYSSTATSRRDIRAEIARTARAGNNPSVNRLYFGD